MPPKSCHAQRSRAAPSNWSNHERGCRLSPRETFQIDIVQELEVPAHLAKALEQAAVRTLQARRVAPPASLTLLISDDNRLQQLNEAFLGEREPTDVLSFPAGDPLPGAPPDAYAPYLGDIALSIPAARRQAEAGGHSLMAECQLLIVHGVLHLLGFDHLDDLQKEEMWRLQEGILRELDVKITPPE